jgi:hypothetical protein
MNADSFPVPAPLGGVAARRKPGAGGRAPLAAFNRKFDQIIQDTAFSIA